MLGKLLLVVVNIFMNSEDAIESMLFHESSRSEASPYDNVIDDHSERAKSYELIN